ncbi:MAG: tRNA lysidine(34) synthetase TilS [Planctomycetota bacterium]|nr:tRNA lysidine(34) synthetase TilS [Planctomycetota bacterium]MDA1211047.1 tRNA lysidine(34) synthetase TilS [Planctomycetota bacterium]
MMNSDSPTPNAADPFASDFLDRLGEECLRLSIQDDKIVMAVSGGADSTALLCGCEKLRRALRIEIAVGHVNHQLRGAASDADEAWVAELCHRLNIPYYSARIDVAAKAAAWKTGIEETARKVRYEYLNEVARETESRFLLTAHTADDQAETILHHILRGTGMGGLKGIAGTKPLSENLTLVRPFKLFARKDILRFLKLLQQDFRDDASNADVGMTRNRIRLSLMPTLERDFNPEVKEALCRLGRQAEEVHDTLAELAHRWFEPAIEAATPNSCRINCDACTEIPPLIVREGLIRLWDRQSWPRQHMGAQEWHDLGGIIFYSSPPSRTFPGSIHAERRGTRLILQRR